MSRQRNELHIKQVEKWKRKNGDLSDDQIAVLFMNGISAVRRKSLGTLSGVTVGAVIDRVLAESQQRFPVLSVIVSDQKGFHFNIFIVRIKDVKPSLVQEALKELLLELLESFGRITSEILTKSLHQELMTITNQTSPKDIDPQAEILLSLARKNRDGK